MKILFHLKLGTLILIYVYATNLYASFFQCICYLLERILLCAMASFHVLALCYKFRITGLTLKPGEGELSGSHTI